MTETTATPYELIKAFTDAKAEAHRLFLLAAGFDGIDTKSPFFTLSDNNPYAHDYNAATLAVVNTREAANTEQERIGEAEFGRMVLIGYREARKS